MAGEDEVVLYYNPQSRARMARWMLEEVGAPYRIELIQWETQDNRKPEFLALNPMGKLPTIEHRGVVVTETAAIIAYLADAFPEAGLAPEQGSPERGPYYRWLFFGSGCIEPAMLDAMGKRGDPANKVAAGYGSYGDVVNTLRSELAKADYLVGGRFTAADLYIAAELGFMAMFGAPGIKGDPVFDAYVARCQSRPAFARANPPPESPKA